MIKDEKGVFIFVLKREVEAYLTYTQLSEIVESKETKSLFMRLAEDEMQHRMSIENIYLQIYGLKLDESEFKDVVVNIPNKLQKAYTLEILKMAIDKEREASTLYQKMAEESESDEVKRLFLKFASVEDGHYEILQAERRKMMDGHYWFTENQDRPLED